ncbi:MAG: xanthine dehydrogenase family protein subunit M [Candidatus Atribacteria bacterium]|nr:xanthine dehydrogenase family protein subunit M [Candidatus Atribacteria bacterium]
MKELDYFYPRTLKESLQILDEHKGDVRVIAGGTDLVPRLKENDVKENKIVDVSRIDEMKGIEEKADSIYIGAATTHTEILESTLIKEKATILYDAVKTIGSPQIRNIGTIGGNIGNASPAGDSIPAFFNLEAKLILKSIEGERVVPIEEFFVGPGKTCLKNNELILGVEFSKMTQDEIGFFRKVGQRRGVAISIINGCVRLQKSEQKNHFKKAFVSLGAVAPTVVRARLVENALENDEVDSLDKIMYIAHLAYREVSPISDVRGSIEYRRDMSINILYEGLAELFLKGWRA